MSDDILKDLGRTNKLGGTLKNSGGAHEAMGSEVADGKIEPNTDLLDKYGENKLGTKLKNSGSSSEKFGNSVAPLTGSLGLGESLWNPDSIARVIGEDSLDLNSLFDAYARSTQTLSVRDFNALLEAHQADTRVDEAGLQMLMNQHNGFTFIEHADSEGRFYLREGFDVGAIAGGTDVALGDEEDVEEGIEDGLAEDYNPRDRNFSGPGAGRSSAGPAPGASSRLPSMGQGPSADPMAADSQGGMDSFNLEDPLAGMDSEGPMGGEFGAGGGQFGGGMADDMGGDMGDGMGVGMGAGAGDIGGIASGMGGDDEGAGFDGNEFGLSSTPPAPRPTDVGGMGGDASSQGLGQGPGGGRVRPQGPVPGGEMDWAEAVAYAVGDTLNENLLDRIKRVIVTKNPNTVAQYCAKHRSNLGDIDVARVYLESAPLKIGLDGMNNVIAVSSSTIGLYDSADQRLDNPGLLEAFDAVPETEGEYRFSESAECEECHKADCECDDSVAEDKIGNDNFKMTNMGRTDKLGGKTKNSGSSNEKFGESKHGEAADGITTELRPGTLGQKLKNSGGMFEKLEHGGDVAPMKGGTAEMHENVQRLNTAVRPHLVERLKTRVNNTVLYKAVAEGVKTTSRRLLSEALVDLEELAQVLGEGSCALSVAFNSPKGPKAFNLPLSKVLKRRGPVVSEGKALFRHPQVARRFADRLLGEGKVVRVKAHNWGASVAAKLTFNEAKTVFNSL